MGEKRGVCDGEGDALVENVLSDQNKVVSLFQFIQELNKLKQKMKEYKY